MTRQGHRRAPLGGNALAAGSSSGQGTLTSVTFSMTADPTITPVGSGVPGSMRRNYPASSSSHSGGA